MKLTDGRIGFIIGLVAMLILLSAGCAGATEVKLTANDGAVRDFFGNSVSISGDYAIVGAYNDDDKGIDSGSAYIFNWDGAAWNQSAKLTASDSATDDNFGFSVSISGDYAIVGAHADDDKGSYSGSAYIFHWNGTAWNQSAKLTASDGEVGDFFGNSVSISGDYAIVGAYGDDDKGDFSGSAYIFHWNGTAWNQSAKLTASDGAKDDFFGYHSVSISGNYAIVGAFRDYDKGDLSGSAYIFHWDGTTWNQSAKLTASDGEAFDFFGLFVSISGNDVIVGAYNDDDKGIDSGSAYIFNWNGTAWNQSAKLTASDGATDDHFGSVSISGDYVIVGAHFDDDKGDLSGSAYIYDGFDTTSPVIIINTPTKSLTTRHSMLELNATFGGEIVAYAWYNVNNTWNSTPISNQNNLTVTLSALSDGAHNVTVFANDSAGNMGSTLVNFTIDTITPTVTIDIPQELNNYTTSTIALNVSADETIVAWQYSINGSTNTTFSPNITLPNLPDGNHNVTVYANDSAGNVGSTLVNFTIDTIAPTVTIDIPQELNNYSTSTVALNVSADESIVSWQYSINGSTNTTFSPNITLPSLPDGNHNVTVYANDSAGNVESARVNFTIDTIPPTAPSNLIHIDDATSGYDNDHSIEFIWDASTDAHSSIIYRIYRNGVLNASTTSTTYTLAGETEGSHKYNVSAQDSTGNMNTTNASVTVIVDYTNPVIHNLSLSDTTPRYKQQIIINVNVTDINIANVTAGGTLLAHQSGALWNGTIIAEHGVNTVTVVVHDTANNSVTNSSLSYTGHASPKNNRGGGSNTGGTISIISPETQVDDDDDNSDDDGDIAPFVKDGKDDDGKSKIPVNTPKNDETTFKTNESNANGFLAKLPGFGLILAIFGMLAMAGYMKRRA